MDPTPTPSPAALGTSCAELCGALTRIRDHVHETAGRLRAGEPADDLLALLEGLSRQSGEQQQRLASAVRELAARGVPLPADWDQRLTQAQDLLAETIATLQTALASANAALEALAPELDASIQVQKGTRAYRAHRP